MNKNMLETIPAYENKNEIADHKKNIYL